MLRKGKHDRGGKKDGGREMVRAERAEEVNSGNFSDGWA